MLGKDRDSRNHFHPRIKLFLICIIHNNITKCVLPLF